MGFMSKVRSLFRGSSLEPGGTAIQIWSAGGYHPRKGTPELFRAYREAPWFYMVNNQLANERSTALRKHRVLFDGPNDDQNRAQIDRTNPRYEVIRLLRRPVQLATGTLVTERMRNRSIALWYGLCGEAYVGKLRDPAGRVVGLVPISPLWVIATPTTSEPYYVICADPMKPPKRVAPGEIIPYVDPDAENPYGRGVGAGITLDNEIDTDSAASEFDRAILENQGAPSGALVIEGASREALETYRAKWRERFGGPTKAGQLEFIGGKATFLPIESGNIFGKSIEQRKFLRDMFCQVHGISPEVLGILDGSTRDSAWVARHSFALNTLVPWLEMATDAEQAYLVPEFVDDPEDACLGYTSPVPEDKELQVRVMATAPGAFKGSDARRVGGFAPDPELDDRPLGAQPQMATPSQLPKGPANRLNEPAWALARIDDSST